MTKKISIVYVTSIFVFMMGFLGLTLLQVHQSSAATKSEFVDEFEKAPLVTSDDNVYVAWWTNKTGNNEVMFRASNDAGLSFGEKINLSNTTNQESIDAMIDAEGDTVAVTWWERNNTANEPVMKISTDAGQTFGPLLQLSQNGTLGITDSSEEE